MQRFVKILLEEIRKETYIASKAKSYKIMFFVDTLIPIEYNLIGIFLWPKKHI